MTDDEDLTHSETGSDDDSEFHGDDSDGDFEDSADDSDESDGTDTKGQGLRSRLLDAFAVACRASIFFIVSPLLVLSNCSGANPLLCERAAASSSEPRSVASLPHRLLVSLWELPSVFMASVFHADVADATDYRAWFGRR